MLSNESRFILIGLDYALTDFILAVNSAGTAPEARS